MKEEKFSFSLLLVIVIGVSAITMINLFGCITSRDITINGQIATTTPNKVISHCPIACTPCIDEPVFDKCDFGDLAYEVLQNRYDIYGQKELSKGDIYYLTSNIFNSDYVEFCNQKTGVNGRCFPPEVILNKKFFKPIN